MVHELSAHLLNPGLFWWAFRPETARVRGLTAADAKTYGVRLPYPGIERVVPKAHHAVLLIDEIDKAEPDLPNDLLEPLDRRRFDLPEGFRVGGEPRISGADDIKLPPRRPQRSTKKGNEEATLSAPAGLTWKMTAKSR